MSRIKTKNSMTIQLAERYPFCPKTVYCTLLSRIRNFAKRVSKWFIFDIYTYKLLLLSIFTAYEN